MRQQHSFVRLVLSSILSFTAMLLFGCGGGHPYTGGSITLSADNANLSAGSSTQLHATQYDILGVPRDISASVTWSSSSASVATVSATGLLTGVSTGTATVTATASSVSGTLGVTIGSPSVSSIAVTPATASVYTNGTQQFTATATYANATTGNVTASTTWSAQPASVATITAAGLLTAVAPGSFTVTAANNGKTATITGTVSNPAVASIAITPANPGIRSGATQQFTATATYADGTTQNVTSSVTWTSSNPAVLSIASSGLATTYATANATSVTLTAKAGSITQTVTVAITPSVTVSQLVIEPTSSSIAAGTAEPHTATAYFSDGTQRDVTSLVTWSVATSTVAAGAVSPKASTTVASVSQTGIDTAITPGTAVLQATYGSAHSLSTVIVTPATVTALDITATRDLIPAGSVQPLILTGTFSDGSHQDLSLTANWQSSNPAVATVDSTTGIATGVSAGNIRFFASFGGLTATTTGFQILPRDLVSTLIKIDTPVLVQGVSEQFHLIGIYSDGSMHDLTWLATWSSADPTVFPIDSKGLAYGLAAGNTQITGTALGKSAILSVTAIPAILQSIQLLPSPTQLALGTTLRMTALGLFSTGAAIDIGDPAVWSSSDPSVATVDSAGRVKSGRPGTTTITASLLGITQSIPVAVTNASLSTLSISPASAVETTSSGHQHTATGIFSDGTLQDLTHDVVWTTTDATVASIDAGGLSLGMKPGQVNVIATFGSQTATAPLTVTAATLLSTTVVPGNTRLPIGVVRLFKLIGRFSDGTTEDLNYDSIWSTATPSIVGVIKQGKAVGVAQGLGTVTAQHGYFSASTPVNVTNATLTGITLTPATASIRRYQTQQFIATGTFSDGFTQTLVDDAVFSSSAPNVVSIGEFALATGTALGTAQITANFQGQTATGTLHVLSDILSSIAVTPANPALTAGHTQQLTATGTYADGTTSDITSQIVWTSSNPAVLAIDANGLATAYATGAPTTVNVTAQLGATTQTFAITVSPATATPPAITLISIAVTPTSSHVAAGTTQQLTLTGTYSDGSMQNLSSAAAWTSSASGNATVSSTGLVTGTAPGNVTITAQLGALQSTAVIIVSSATLQSVALSPTGASFANGSTQQFTLTGTFTDGTTQNLSTQATWSTNNPAVAGVSPTGLVTGTGTGSVTIAATFNGQTATTSTQVTPATIVSLAITPSTASFAKGTTQQFHVLATYTDGTTHDVTGIASFSSSSPATVSITSAGLALAMGTGSAQIAVTIGTQTATTQSVTITPATLTTIAIYPGTVSFANGTTEQFTAIATFSDGSTQDVTSQVVWTSSNPASITIDANGIAASLGTGTAQIAATLNGTTATTGPITVTPATLSGISITPLTAQIARGTTQQFTATGTYTDGTTQNVTSSVTWTSTTPAAGIDAAGLATGNSNGVTQISATYQAKTAAPATLTVTNASLLLVTFNPALPSVAAGASTQIAVIGHYSDGSTQDLTGSATFSSSNPSVATVSNTGVVAGIAPGISTVTVTAGGDIASFAVSVTNATLVSIAISPAPANVARGNTQQFTATGTYSDGSLQNVTGSVTWQSSVPAVATIDTSGLATGVNGGLTQIWASLGGHTAMATMTVSPATLVSLAITPATASLANGTSQQYRATGTMTDGSTQDLTASVTWSSSNTSIATVDLLGFATTHSLGAATLTAAAGAVNATAALNVTAATPTSVQLTPAVLLLPAGGTQQLLATATFSDGTSQNVTTSVTYTSSNHTAATVDLNGKLTAASAGVSTITATLGSVSASSLATITTATLSSIAVTPANPSLAAGESQQLTTTGTYTDGSTQDLTHAVLWTSSNPLVAGVSLTGNVTAALTGTATVNATFLTVSANTTITVSSAVVTSIAVTPASVTLAAGQTKQFTATATLSDLTQQDVTHAASWSVSDPARATITGNGGFLTTTASGALNVTATLNTTSGSAVATIQPAALSSLTLTPSPLSLPAGIAQQLAATGHYTDGSTADLTASATYASSLTSAASVDANGLVRAVGTGSATITVTVGGVSMNVSTTVTNATLSSIAIAPAAPSLPAGVQQQLTATGTYSDGSTADITTQVQWSSSSPTVATVSGTGLVISLTTGTSTLTASLNGVSQTTPLTVTAAVLQSIAVTASQSSFALGLSLQLTATGTYSDGTTRDLTATTAWSSQAPAIGIVNAAGLATGVATGSFTAAASTNGVTGTLSITVLNAVLQSIVVTPANSLILNVLGGQIQYTATGHFSDGSTQNITNTVHWAITSGLTLGSISSTGSFSPIALGLGTITATSGAVSGSTGFTVVSVL